MKKGKYLFNFFNVIVKNHLLIFFFCFLFISISYCQNTTFYVKCNESKSVLSGVNVNFLNGKFTQSDLTGKVELNNSEWEEILISHIGFNDLKLKITELNDTIYLSQKIYSLDALTINSRNKNKNKNKIILPQFSFNRLSLTSHGTGSPLHHDDVKAVFIPFRKEEKNHQISRIIISTTNYNIIYLDSLIKKAQKNVQNAPFWINLYSVDSVVGVPDKPLFKRNLMAQRKINEKYAFVTFDKEEQIIFPKHGIFIVIGAYNDEFYKKLNFVSAPAIKNVGISNKSKFKLYNRRKAFFEPEGFFWELDRWSEENKSVYYVGLELEKCTITE